MEGKSIFFTGSAGTGKSFLLRKIIADLRRSLQAEGRVDAVFVTAPTGIAACNVGGVTVNSFAGIGLGNLSAEAYAAQIQRKPSLMQRWRACRVLVIDEVSMMDGGLFDKLERIARLCRGERLVFGGIQLVLAGDFYQLPPVGLDQARGGGGGVGGTAVAAPKARYGDKTGSDAASAPATFCFEANCWSSAIFLQMSLQRVFRQRDAAFVQMLNEMRVGKVSPATRQLLQSGCGADIARLQAQAPALKPTRLFAVNAQVDRVNDEELRNCPGPARTFFAKDDATEDTFLKQLHNLYVPERLQLKVGAQVILLKNLDATAGLVNGARGTVRGFAPSEVGGEEVPVVAFLRPGGDASLASSSSSSRGRGDDGDGGIRVERAEWTIELGSTMVARRSQLPLKLAYAMSIHKSQGMTLDLLEVSLDRVFEYGQAYVALSRAVSLGRLRVAGFVEANVRAHPRVSEFYRKLVASSQVQRVEGVAEKETTCKALRLLPQGPTAPASKVGEARREQGVFKSGAVALSAHEAPPKPRRQEAQVQQTAPDLTMA
jgi:ATP-dependent DNA helicase PIF1